jgi:hypothetical protein
MCFESESYITIDGQPTSLSWNKAPIWGIRPDFYYYQTVAVLLFWGALSDERTGLSFTIFAGPRQRCHSRVPVPWDSQPYFTVPDSRLPFSSRRTTRRVTVEVFYSASTRMSGLLLSVSLCYNRQPVGLEDTLSNPLVSRFLMRRPLTYSLPWKLHC